MRTTHAARLRACLPVAVLAALVLSGRALQKPTAPGIPRPSPTSGDAGLFLYYRDVDRLLAAGKEMEAVLALGDAPGAPICLGRAADLPTVRQGGDPGALVLRIAEGLARRAKAAASVRHGQRARIYALHCRALALRLQAGAATDAQSRALAGRVRVLADGAARVAA